MPKLSIFNGIEIIIRGRERNHRLPHFHATYADGEVSLAIATLEILCGKIENRALSLVLEWAALHQEDLLRAWNEVRAGQVPKKIAPL